MNISKKEIDQTNAIVTIRIEKADYTDLVKKQLQDYRKKANMPGFRPGMVPLGLLKKMYGKAILAEEVNKLVSKGLYDYINDNDLHVLGEPLPNETEQPRIDFDTQEDFEFVFDIALAPEFELDLNKKDKLNFYKIEITDEMIDKQIESYTERYGKYLQEEIVEEKDMIKGDLVGLSGSELKVEGAVLTPAYMKDEDQKNLFVGAKKGDTIIFNPKKAFENATEISSLLKISKEEAEALDCDCQVTIEGITRYQKAEVNQELFDKVYGDNVVKNEEEFRAKVKADIEVDLSSNSDYKLALDARELLLTKVKDIQFPDAFIKRWLLTANKELTEEKLEEDYTKTIESLKWQLIKDKIAKTNDIKIEESDITEQAKKAGRAQFAQYGMLGIDDSILDNYVQDMMKKEEYVRAMIDRVAEDKVIEIVKNTIKLTEKTMSADDFNKMFEQK